MAISIGQADPDGDRGWRVWVCAHGFWRRATVLSLTRTRRAVNVVYAVSNKRRPHRVQRFNVESDSIWTAAFDLETAENGRDRRPLPVRHEHGDRPWLWRPVAPGGYPNPARALDPDTYWPKALRASRRGLTL